MSVKPVTYYMVECDHRDCDAETGSHGDFSAWAEESAAHDDWTNDGGLILNDGRAFCEEHARDFICDHCGDEGVTTTKDPYGDDRICVECSEVSA